MAAWLTLRHRRFLGQRELLGTKEWSGQLMWRERYNLKRRVHRPDLVGWVESQATAVEVELAGKSNVRIDAILGLHRNWIREGKTHQVMYVCGGPASDRHVHRAIQRCGMTSIRVESLDTIHEQTLAAFELERTNVPRSVAKTGSGGRGCS